MYKKVRRNNLTLVGILILVIVVAAVAVLGVLWYFDIPRTWQAFRLFSDSWSRDSNEFQMTLTLDTGDTPVELNGGFSWIDRDDGRVFRLELEGADLYLANNLLCFENGRAYALTDATEDFTIPSDFLAFLGGMTISGGKEEGFTVTALESDGPGLQMELHQAEGSLSQLILTVNSEMDGTPVQVRLLLEPTGNAPDPIPEAVRTAIENGTGSVEPLTTSLLRLWSAWAQLADAGTVGADVTWSVQGGVLRLGDTFTFYRTSGPDGPVYSVGKDSFTTFDPEMPKTDTESAAASLPGILYAVLADGDTSCTADGGQYVYSLSLDTAAMESICYALAPEAEELWITFQEGSVSLILSDSRLTQISVQCSGEIEALILNIPVSLELNAVMLEDPVFPE